MSAFRNSTVVSPACDTINAPTLREAKRLAKQISRDNPQSFAKAVAPSGREFGFVAGLKAELCDNTWMPDPKRLANLRLAGRA